ncbi:MAG: class I adenylate-forming enzyme family protein, partial [Bacillota bacterium]|nr:class I adenylate-forming enzyme family protein [Bacillota bacterium]
LTNAEIKSANPLALVLHSGGTTGKVKGVCLSNSAVNTSAQQMMDANPMICAEDRFLSVMPIFHGNGLVIGIHAMLMLGARCVLIPRFTPETYAKDLLKNKCNYMSGVPVLFEKLIETDIMKNADLSFLKGVFSGADFLSVELEKKINNFLISHNSKVMVRQGYGMTEGVVATTLNPPDCQKPGSIGVPLPGVDVKIVKPNTFQELPTGEIGEIVFTSDTNMMCYYNEPEETANTMQVHKDGKTWIHSGDLGLKDEEGFFYFKGRIKRMIVKNGYNIFPNELESTIESFEMVDRCCIIDYPISEGACIIKAYIVLNPSYQPSENLKLKILDLCKDEIAKYALPKEIEFINEIPKTLVGKVDYNALREMLKQK